MKAAIVGTGFLGEQIYNEIKDHCDEIILTHNKNQKYPDSRKFDFFKDDFSSILGDKKIDIIFLSAKIEFIENENFLKEAMIGFLNSIRGKKIVYISSDGIFNGQRGLYKEIDIPNPVTLYGRNLKICEDMIKEKIKNYCILRPSYLYGFVNNKLDSRFEKIKKEVSEGKEITRFTDMYKSPLSYKQSAEAIKKISFSNFIGTMHISGERKSIYEFTKEGMEALGFPINNLRGVLMPKERPADFLPDTSLDFTLMQKTTGIEPISISESFKRFWSESIDKNHQISKQLR